jgi:hypothetical protein
MSKPARFLIPLAAVAAAVIGITGCSNNDEEVMLEEPMPLGTMNASFGALPADIRLQVVEELPEQAEVTSVETVNASTGQLVFIINYIVDGDAETRAYDRSGKRLAVFEPAAPPSLGGNSGPIRQEASSLDDTRPPGDGITTGDSPVGIGEADIGADVEENIP